VKSPTYVYSRISSDSVCNLITWHYDLTIIIKCNFYVSGLHDNYLIETINKKYILRIYRNDWRSKQDVAFELELLNFIDDKAAAVCAPLITKTKHNSFTIDSPEGKRLAALFPYADGVSPGKEMTVEQGFLLGKSIAHLHNITDTFETDLPGRILDITYLLDESVIAINPFLDEKGKKYLSSLQSVLHDIAPSLQKKPEVYGICIGDVNPTNFHINSKNHITLFDFDQCGYGFRTFEIGKFISSIHTANKKHEISQSFLDAYQTVRQLSDEEVSAIPYYELISFIWVMAIHAYNSEYIGHKYLQKTFWDKRIEVLKALQKTVVIAQY